MPTCPGSPWTWLPTGTRWAMLGSVLLNSISYWMQWKHIHHLRKLEAFFQDLFGCNWISLQNKEGCTDKKQDALKNAWFPHEGCVKSRDGWWRGAGGLFVSPDFGIWPFPSSPALVGQSRPRFTSPGLHSPLPTPICTQGPQAATSDAKFQPGGPICKIRCYSPFEKTSKENSHIMLSACSGKIWP